MDEQPDQPTRSQINLLLLAATILCVLFLWTIRNYLVTMFIAAIFTAMVFPLYQRLLTRARLKPGLSAGLSVFAFFLLVVAPALMLIGMFAEQAQGIVASGRPWVEAQVDSLRQWAIRADNEFLLNLIQSVSQSLRANAGDVATRTASFAVSTVAGLTSGVALFFLHLTVFIFAMFYFFREGKSLLKLGERASRALFGVRAGLSDRIYEVSRATIQGTIAIALVQGVLCGLGLYLAGIKTAVFWGAMTVILAILPVVGTALVWAPASFYLIANGQYIAGIALFAWGALVVSVVDNLLRPSLVGSGARLPDLIVLVSTLGGLAIFGFAGIVIGPVIAAVAFSSFETALARVENADCPGEGA